MAHRDARRRRRRNWRKTELQHRRRAFWRVLTAGACVCALVGLLLALATKHQQRSPFREQLTALPAIPVEQRPVPPLESPSQNTPSLALREDFSRLQVDLPATVGIAVAPVGNAQTLLLLGDWVQGPAWSTIKVPLVLAAYREAESPEINNVMVSAITASDNAAAEQLWSALGEPETAALKVQAVLAEAGDPTVVQSKRVRPEFSAFGQTRWSLADQVRFISAMACSSEDAPVLGLMGEIESGQSWGLGTLTGSRFKGGWGPDTGGQYLVRQLGVIETSRGTAAVAIAAEPESGAFLDGVNALNRVASWLSTHAGSLPAGQCPR